MFDFGWAELLVIAAVAVLVIGPKELPAIMFTLGRLARRLQYMRFALSQQFEDFMLQNDLNELRRDAALRLAGEDKGEGEADLAHNRPAENAAVTAPVGEMEPIDRTGQDEPAPRKD
jgi:sec-independent protein translocase protein TatB